MTEPVGFWRIAEAEPDRIAVIDTDGTELTYGALAARVNQMSNAMATGGIAPGDVVCALLGNGSTIVTTFLAAMQSGVYFTPINIRWTGREIAYLIEDSQARGIVTDIDLDQVTGGDVALEAVQACELGWKVSATARPGFVTLDEVHASASTAPPAQRMAGERMLYTSGTTGTPKGIRRPLPAADPDQVAEAMVADHRTFGLEPAGTHLVLGPMYHAAPLFFAAMALHLRCRIVITDRWDSEAVLRDIERHGVTSTHMVPTMFERLLALPDATRRAADTSSLRTVVHAAAPCPISTKHRMIEWLGPIVHEYYGATEGGGTVVSPQEWLKRPGTVGRARPGSHIMIIGDDDEECPPNVAGSIYIRPAGAPFAYLNAPEKTASAYRGDHFTVGDIGHLDEDGYLFIRGRTAELIISGGVNIYPAEVEQVLLAHPGVADAAVLGLPDPEWGETVVAVVQPAATGQADELIAELATLCRRDLAGYKCPRRFELWDELPRELTGKLRKGDLRSALMAGDGGSVSSTDDATGGQS